MTSRVFVEDVAITADIGVDCFGRHGKPQPLLISAYIDFDFKEASANDDVTKALDYRGVNKAIKSVDGFDYGQKSGLVPCENRIVETMVDALALASADFRIRSHAPKAIMHCEGGLTLETKYRYSRDRPVRERFDVSEQAFTVRDLRVSCIIGIGKEERVIKQPVLITLTLKFLEGERIHDAIIKQVANGVYQLVEISSYQTLEALVQHIYNYMEENFHDYRLPPSGSKSSGRISLGVKVAKPAVFAGAAGPGVEIQRDLHWTD